MRRKLGIILMLLGTLLILGALCLFLSNQQENATAQTASQEMLIQIQEAIQKTVSDEDPAIEASPENNTPVELLKPEDLIMTEKVIRGYPCIGYVSIPELNVQLPVITNWDGKRLQTAPCRFSGTVKGRDLVIMAHSYDSHFGRLESLSEGSEVQFTDMDGNIWNYEVILKDVLDATAVDEMVAGEYDLTLFTCTTYHTHRVTVRCNLIEK